MHFAVAKQQQPSARAKNKQAKQRFAEKKHGFSSILEFSIHFLARKVR